MTNSATSKFQIIEFPPLPGKCANCGKGPGRGTRFIDWNLSEEFYGAIVFCFDCAREIARAIDYAPVAELLVTQDALEFVKTEVVHLRKENDKLSNVIHSLRIVRSDLDLDPPVPNSLDTPDSGE